MPLMLRFSMADFGKLTDHWVSPGGGGLEWWLSPPPFREAECATWQCGHHLIPAKCPMPDARWPMLSAQCTALSAFIQLAMSTDLRTWLPEIRHSSRDLVTVINGASFKPDPDSIQELRHRQGRRHTSLTGMDWAAESQINKQRASKQSQRNKISQLKTYFISNFHQSQPQGEGSWAATLEPLDASLNLIQR